MKVKIKTFMRLFFSIVTLLYILLVTTSEDYKPFQSTTMGKVAALHLTINEYSMK